MSTKTANTAAKTNTVATAPAKHSLQRQCACGNHTAAGGECASCATKKLQKKLAIGATNDPLELEADRVAEQVLAYQPAHSFSNVSAPKIQRRAEQASPQTEEVPASVERVLAGSGSPLPITVRKDMEQRFGQDFSQVRMYTGSTAEQSAREVKANAYTLGNNIVFNQGKFSPETHAGKRLLAHELTHVLQQSNRTDLIQRDPAPAQEAPGGPPPFYGMAAAPEALSGIQLAFKVKAIPHADSMRFNHTIARPPYSIKTYTRKGDNGGPPVIVYYNVVRTEPGLIGPTLWTEYYVGPDAIVNFLAEVPIHAGAASMSYMFGPPAPNAVEGARFVEAVMAGEGREAASAYGSSLYESVTDPGWWVQMLSGVAGMFEAPAVAVTPRPPPTLRLISSQPARVASVVGRSTAVSLPTSGANALKAVAAEAPRAAPAVRLVPAPAAAKAPLTRPAPLIPPEIASAVTASISASRSKVAAPSTKSKKDDEEDRKTGDACQRRLGLRPGINARWHVQRPAINGHTTVLAAAFRLDKGIPPPPGQDTTQPSRDWTHAIGRPADDAGHLIGNRFGGQATFNATNGNIFPQDLSFNRGTMVSYDKVIAQKHTENCDVCANIGLIYESEKSLRPSASLYTYFWRSPGAKDFNPPVSALVPNR